MKFNEQSIALFKDLTKTPTDTGILRDAGILYWNILEELVVRCVHEKLDLKTMLATEYDFVNYGITSEVLDNAPAIASTLRAPFSTNPSIKVFVLSEWLLDKYSKIMSGDKKETLDKEIKQTEMSIIKLENEIRQTQEQRKNESMAAFLKAAPSNNLPVSLQANLTKLELTDKLFRQISKIKRTISKGAFLSVKDRRQFCDQEKEYAALLEQNEAFALTLEPRETIAAVKRSTLQINEHSLKIIDCEEAIVKMHKEILDLDKKQQAISLLEIEAALRSELNYVRDLVKLSAKRLHSESCSILRGEDKFFSIKELCSCIDRVIEFDPAIFNNSRVPNFGIPSVLVVPCNGNAVYDWKNNMIIVPLVPPMAGFMASIAFGMIEYRLDVDEDKQLLASYNKLPQHKDVKSIFSLKTELTKDYIAWMTSEYKGYKVLPKEIRKWFEHEIAPNKNEIAVPLELRTFLFGGEAYAKKCKDVESGTLQDLDACPENLLWESGILQYQQGKFDRSLDLFKALVNKNPGNTGALFNAAQACMQLMRKQEAIDFFNEYFKRNPQSWWAGVALEHVRRLQTGHSS